MDLMQHADDEEHDEREERLARALARAAAILAKADEEQNEPRPAAINERDWAEWELGRVEAERRRQWEEKLERSRSRTPEPAPTPAPAPRYLTLAAANQRQAALEGALREMIRRERAIWREEVAKLQIQIDALVKGRSNDEE